MRSEMTFKEYQNSTHETAIYPSSTEMEAVTYCTLGLASESAEICGKLKKIMRDNNSIMTPERKQAIVAELGDVMWYVSELCTSLGVSMEEVAQSNLEKLKDRQERNVIQGDGDDR